MTEQGVPPSELNDDDLRRELQHVHEKRHDMLVEGTADQFRNNLSRTLDLEREYLRRFANSTPDAEDKAAVLG